MRIVLDTNCLLMIIPKTSEFVSVWQAFKNRKYTLCYTTEILFEYLEILTQFYSVEVAKNITDVIVSAPNSEAITNYYHWNLITADPDDNKFVDCAITANASYLVSNDKHFDILKKIDFPKVDILTIDEFKATL